MYWQWSLLTVLAGACAVFPSDLTADEPSAGDGGLRGADAGADARPDEAPPCPSTGCPRATLVFAESGSHHRALGVAADEVVWSSQVGMAYEIKRCKWNDCAKPASIVSRVCKDPVPLTGFFVVSGTKIFLTGAECRGWLCASDVSRAGTLECSYGDSFYRLAGDARGIFGTSANFMQSPIVEKVLGNILVSSETTTSPSSVSLTGLPDTVSTPVATSEDYVGWLEMSGSQDAPDSFSIKGCTRDLIACTPKELAPTRAGVPSAFTAGKTSFFVSYIDASGTRLLRATPGGGVEEIASASSPTMAMTTDADHLYFSEGRRIERCPLTGPCTPEVVGTTSEPVEFLATSSDGERLFVLEADGLYTLPLPRER